LAVSLGFFVHVYLPAHMPNPNHFIQMEKEKKKVMFPLSSFIS